MAYWFFKNFGRSVNKAPFLLRFTTFFEVLLLLCCFLLFPMNSQAVTISLSIDAPSTATVGNSFYVTVTMENTGSNSGANDMGYLDISFPENPTVTIDSYDSWWDSVDQYPAGSLIYHRDGYQFYSSYILVSAEDEYWASGDSLWVKLKVTPVTSGNLHIYYRGTIGNMVKPTSGYMDQQGWYVYRKTIGVAASPSITSINPTSGPRYKLVTINGSDFGSSQGSSYVRFGSYTANVISWSSSQIKVEVPSSLSVGSSYGVYVHTSAGDSNSKTFTVQSSPLPQVSVSGIPGQVEPNQAFSLTVTISNNGGIADWGGVAISFPFLNEMHSGMASGGPYDTSQGRVSRSGGTIPSGDISFCDHGDLLADVGGSPGYAEHLLVDTATGSFTGSKTITLTVTPKIATSDFKIRIRGFMSVGGTYGYEHVYRDPSSSGSGRELDQQSYWAYAYSVNIAASPSITSINPTSGPRYKLVTINGSDFGSSQGSSYVRFGSYTANVISWSSSQIKVEVPSSLSVGSSYGVYVHTSAGDSNSKTFTVQSSPLPQVSVSGIPGQVEPNQAFSLTVTISNNGGIADWGGVAISFPFLNEMHSGMASGGPYDTSQGRVSRSGGTIPSGDISFCDHGDLLADVGGSPGYAEHLLVDTATGSFTGSKTITLTVTPKIATSDFKIRIRGFMSVGGTYGYEHVYRDPSSSGSGRELDQQSYWAYAYSVNVYEQPQIQIIDKNISTTSSRDGRTITVGYKINSPSATTAWLGCTLTGPNFEVVEDPGNDDTITLNAGINWYYRDFFINLPPQALSGQYDVTWGVHWGSDEADYVTETDYLTISPPIAVRVPILVYHKVGPTAHTQYWITTNMFRAHMEALKAYNYTAITLQDLMDYRAEISTPPSKPILITIDDGYENLITEIHPILSDPNINYKATSFLITGRVGGTNAWDAGDNNPIINHLTWNQIQTLHAYGLIDFQSHSVMHPDLTTLTSNELLEELVSSKLEIENRLTKEVKFISWPYGIYNGEVQTAARDVGYFGATAGLDDVETTSYDKWALKRVLIDWNTSVDYDQDHPWDFFFNKIEDPDVVVPEITINSIEYIDPSNGQPLQLNQVETGESVKIRVTAINSGPSAIVKVSLNLDSDANHSNGIIYDSHLKTPSEDIVRSFSPGQQIFEWTWQVPVNAPLGQYYAAVGFHDQHYVLGFKYSGWQEAFSVVKTDVPSSWGPPSEIASHNLLGQTYSLREYLDGNRLVVFKGEGQDAQLVTNPSLIQSVLLYHSFLTSGPDLGFNTTVDIANSAQYWKEVAEAFAANINGNELTEAQKERTGIFYRRVFLSYGGLVGSTLLGVYIGAHFCGVGAIPGAMIGLGIGILGFGALEAAQILDLSSDLIGDEFIVDEHQSWLNGIAFLFGDEAAQANLDSLTQRRALADRWDQAGATFEDIANAISITGIVAGAARIEHMHQLYLWLGNLGHKAFIETPMAEDLEYHMDLDCIKNRIEYSKHSHFMMLQWLSASLSSLYDELGQKFISESSADEFGRLLVEIALARKLFLENKNELAYSVYKRAKTWAQLGSEQAAFEYLGSDIEMLHAEWTARFNEYVALTNQLDVTQELCDSYSATAELSYDELGVPYYSPVDIRLSNENNAAELCVGSDNSVELMATNLSDEELTSIELSLASSDSTGIAIFPCSIASIPPNSSVVITCNVQFPMSAITPEDYIISPEVVFEYEKGGISYERRTRLQFRLTLPIVIYEVKPNKLFPDPSESLDVDGYILSNVQGLISITPIVYFRESFSQTLPTITVNVQVNQKTPFYFAWTAPDATAPKGTYSIRFILQYGSEQFESDFPVFVYMLPRATGDLAAFDMANAAIVTPNADYENDGIAKRVQAAFDIPDERVLLLDGLTAEELLPIMRRNNLILVGGHIANILVDDLISRGKLTAGLWQQPGDATIHVLEDPFVPVAEEGNSAIVMAGYEINDTYAAGMGLIWQKQHLPVISSLPDQTCQEGVMYTGPTPVVSGMQPVTWSLVAGPSGMSIESTTGVVSWPNPIVSGSPHTITIRATNSAGRDDVSWQLTVVSVGIEPVIAPISDESITEGIAYSGPVPTLTQGTQPVTWSLQSGPSGMTINSSTGVVSWPNPTVAGSPHAVIILATNSAGSDDESWLITVTTAPEVAPVIAPISNHSTEEGTLYAGPNPTLTQGTLPVTWSLQNGPSGMTIDSSTGVVSWSNPTVAGSPHMVTIRATNLVGSDDESWLLTVTSTPVAPIIAPISDDSIAVGISYTGPMPTLIEGTQPINWSLQSGPSGMTIDSSTGVVSWPNPIVVGSQHTVTIRATNSAGYDEESWQLSVTTNEGSITGVVRDSAGNPLGDITVSACDYDMCLTPYSTTSQPETGEYTITSLPSGDYRVIAGAMNPSYIPEFYNNTPDYYSASRVTVTAPDTTTGIDFSLEPAGSISGVVRDSGGTPLGSIWVVAYDYDTGDYAGYTWSQEETGEYTINQLPSGDYRVNAEGSGGYLTEYYDNTPDYNSASRVTVTAPDTTTNIDFSLDLGGTISGRVIDDSGTGIQSAQIRAIDTSTERWVSSAESNETGDYQIQGLATGLYKVYAYVPGANYVPEYYDNVRDYDSATPVDVTQGQDRPDIDFVLEVGGIITGRVTDDSTGSGIENVCIGAYEYDSNTGSINFVVAYCTDANGDYVLPGVPTNVDIILEAYPPYGENYLGEWYDNAPTPEQATPINLSQGETQSGVDFGLAPGAIIEGRVTDDSTGNGIENIYIYVYSYDASQGGVQRDYSWWEDTDANGDYQVMGLPAGTYAVRAYPYRTNYISEWYDDVLDPDHATLITLGNGETRSGVDFGLAPGAIIEGRVTDDSTGNGIENIYIYVYSYDASQGGVQWDYSWWGYTDANGDYQVMGLPAGTYAVRDYPYGTNYIHEWYDDVLDPDQATLITLAAEETRSGVDFGLAPGAIIEGRVTDDSTGNGIENVSVGAYAYDANQGGVQWSYSLWGYTNANGDYQVMGLPAGTYVVRADTYGTNYISEWYDDVLGSDQAALITLAAEETRSGVNFGLSQGGSVTGVVRDSQGNPLGGIQVSVSDYDTGYGFGGAQSEAGTGAYTITGLPSGDYRVSVGGSGYLTEYYNNTPDYNSASRVTVTAPDTTTGIDFSLELGGSITGVVRDNLGNPLGGIQVSVSDYDIFTWPRSAMSEAGTGAYTIKGLPSGDYRVSAGGSGGYLTEYYNNAPDYYSASRVTVTAPDTTTGIDFSLDPGGIITGTVYDETFTAIGGVSVYAVSTTQGWSWGTSSSTSPGNVGVYEFTVPPATYILVRAGGSSWPSGNCYIYEWWQEQELEANATPVTVAAGEVASGIDFTLAPAGSIAGSVIDSGGTGIPGIVVDIRDPVSGRELSNTSTSATGDYQISCLDTGEYIVFAGLSCSSYQGEYYNDALDFFSATPVTVGQSQDVTGIDFSLAYAPVEPWNGGPDSFGYTATTDVPFVWLDATIGTQLSLADDDSANINIGFDFSFYGTSYNSVNISSNGFLSFGDAGLTTYFNYIIPFADAPNALIAPFWDDLNPGSGGAVYYHLAGTAPNRQFIVEWHAVPHFLNIGSATFQAILHEGTNEITFQYQDVDFGNSWLNCGRSASIGIENADGSVGLLYSLSGEHSVTSIMAIRFYPPSTPPQCDAPTNLTSTPADGSVGLNWDGNGLASSYNVYRSEETGTGYSLLAPVTAPAITYTDNDPTVNRTIYYYVVTAVCNPESDYSNEVSNDVDVDGLSDCWEIHYFGDTRYGPDDDPDNDRFTNIEEFLVDSDPTVPDEVISQPGRPTGETSPVAGQSYTYCTSGATSNLGHTVEYSFDWGDGSAPSPWSTSTCASHTWTDTNQHMVRVRARCQIHTNETNISAGLKVNRKRSIVPILNILLED